MNAIRNSATLLCACALLVVASACAGKKKPVHSASATPVVVETPVQASPAIPLDAGDAVESPLDGDLLAATEHAYATGLLGEIYFQFDESTLLPEARERLARNAEFLRSRPEFVVSIEGHCDDRGTDDYNLALGERRAQTTRDYLVSLGIPPSRLQTISFGEERPVCREGNEGCWQRNRRSHFVLSGRVAARG